MPTPTYIPLANVTLGSSAASVTFSSIPATYRDLILVCEGRTQAGGAMGVGGRFNGDTGSNYPDVYMLGTGSSTGSGSSTATSGGFGYFDSGRSNFVVNIMDYMATDKHKTFLIRLNASAAQTVARAGRWSNTAAITSINLFNSSGNGELFGSNSTFNLYGVIA